MQFIRNLGRRKVRTGLTILGITIGIWALVVFGSMANKIDSLVAGGSDFYRDKVTVNAKGGIMGMGGPMAIETADQIAQLPGVAVVVPHVTLLMSDDAATMSMSAPQVITSATARRDLGRETFPMHYASGRAIETSDEGQDVVVLGSDIARQHHATVGGTMLLRGRPFTIVGILEPTLTAPDGDAIVPLTAAQQLFVATLPPVIASKLTPSDVATGFTVYPDTGAKPEAIADEIDAAVPDTATMTQSDFNQQIGSSMAILNAILVGIGLISLIVGGLSVVNTMAMSIAERTREIGIKRAIGGSRPRIVRELVVEAALIGLIGGLIGLGLGAGVVFLADESGRSSGTVLFELTARTAATALLFSTLLGAIAGFVPALHAASLDPVSALRYE
jgi:putative ABC transport system permease protein